MSEIIDILTISPAWLPRFTVDKAEAGVPTFYPRPGEGEKADNSLKNAIGNSIFQNGDSFSLLTAGLVLPESFTQYKDVDALTQSCIKLIFFLTGASGKNYTLDTLGQQAQIPLPHENYETAFDIFINAKKQTQLLHPEIVLNEEFFLQLIIDDIMISMAGIPAALDGKTLAIVPYIKILHNFQLASGTGPS
jgi:hypothetical protein